MPEEDYTNSKWTNESFTIEWHNVDVVKITNRFGGELYIDGGDFEGILNTLYAVYSHGKADAIVEMGKRMNKERAEKKSLV